MDNVGLGDQPSEPSLLTFSASAQLTNINNGNMALMSFGINACRSVQSLWTILHVISKHKGTVNHFGLCDKK